MAGSVVTTSNNFPLTLSWIDYPTDQTTVTYNLANGILTRNYYFDNVLKNTMNVANNVSSTFCIWPYFQANVNSSQTLEVNIKISNESRTFIVFPRVVQTTTPATSTTTIAAPSVSGISPSSGPTGGGTSVTITGTNLLGVTAVNFGVGNPATSFVSGGATQITATSPPGTGTVHVTVTTAGGNSDPNATGSADQFTYLAGAVSASASTVVANPTSVVANGTMVSTITVTLLNANSSPVSGKTVTLAQTSGPGTPTIAPASGTSNSSGVVTFTATSTTAGADIFTATDTTDSITITQTATVTFTAGTVSAGISTVVASPAYGSSTSTITVTLLDANSNPVSGKTGHPHSGQRQFDNHDRQRYLQ